MSQMHLPLKHCPLTQGALQDSCGHTTLASGQRKLPALKP
jgi:hypothetical protein